MQPLLHFLRINMTSHGNRPMKNAQQTLKVALAAATLGATGAHAAVVTESFAAGTTSVSLPNGGISFNSYLTGGFPALDAIATGSVEIGSVVSAGTVVDGNMTFASTQNLDKAPFVTNIGNDQLLAFEITNGGQTQYGVLTFDVSTPAFFGPFSAQIDSLTYDTSGGAVTAGVASSVPEPSSLALLAAGALGLAAYRRRQHASRA